MFEKINPRTNETVKVIKRVRKLCGRNKSHTLTVFEDKEKREESLSSPLRMGTRCDIHKDGSVLNLHRMFLNGKCNFQKQVRCTPEQFQFEGNGYKNTMKKNQKQ